MNESICAQCERPFSGSKVVPGGGITRDKKTICYECYYKNREWDIYTCVECGNIYDDNPEEIHHTYDGPVCKTCDELPPESASEAEIAKFASNMMSTFFGRETSREKIATVMFATEMLVDRITTTICNVNHYGTSNSDEPIRVLDVAELASHAVVDADMLLAELNKEKK